MLEQFLRAMQCYWMMGRVVQRHCLNAPSSGKASWVPKWYSMYSSIRERICAPKCILLPLSDTLSHDKWIGVDTLREGVIGERHVKQSPSHCETKVLLCRDRYLV